MSHETLTMFKCSDCGGLMMGLLKCDQSCDVTCNGNKVEAIQPKTEDKGSEKHVPVIEKIDGGYKVKVGDVPHPMEDEHWIQFIELKVDDKVYYEFLHPGQAPEATFMVEGDNPRAREYCNVHGLWIKE
ncbi:MAG: desulfoferrodoxin family protein [Phycisphaerae bacterium]